MTRPLRLYAGAEAKGMESKFRPAKAAGALGYK